MSGVITTGLNGLYTLICRNPETAGGGLAPSEAIYHSEAGFIYDERVKIDSLESSAIDRRVEVIYNGTIAWGNVVNGLTRKQRRVGVVVRIGYYVGDHELESYKIMGDDEQIICNAVLNPSTWPEGIKGCVQGYIPQTSQVQVLDANRMVLEITLEMIIYGTP